jgi:hypothetical protein
MALPPLETISSKIKSESVTTKHHQTNIPYCSFIGSQITVFPPGPALILQEIVEA